MAFQASLVSLEITLLRARAALVPEDRKMVRDLGEPLAEKVIEWTKLGSSDKSASRLNETRHLFYGTVNIFPEVPTIKRGKT